MYKDCHGGAKEVFQIGKVSVWGCAGMHVSLVPHPLVAQISFSSDITEEDVRVNNTGRALFKNSLAYFRGLPNLPYMHIDWADRHEPPVPFIFWKHLVADLMQAEGNLVVNCVGGHGRTGTALTCIAWAAHLVPKGEDAVAWIRKIYCKEAIESKDQFAYLKDSGVYTKLEYAPPVYVPYNDVWVKCTTCQYYASPAGAKECQANKLPVRCDTCSGTNRSISWFGGRKDEKEFCEICNFSLTKAEEARSKTLGVNICKECEMKFGSASLVDEKRETNGEKEYLNNILNAGYVLPGGKHDKPA